MNYQAAAARMAPRRLRQSLKLCKIAGYGRKEKPSADSCTIGLNGFQPFINTRQKRGINMRESGILYPISSLPSRYGIGCLSKEAYEFVDFLSDAGQSYWQILPIGPTGFGDSPYQSFSTFAGNPYFICLETLAKEGLLTEAECAQFDFGSNPERVDYGALYNSRFKALRIAYERFTEQGGQDQKEYQAFLEENGYWLKDFALFRAIKNSRDGQDWTNWDADLRSRKKEALEAARGELQDEILFFYFQQYEFNRQWQALHAYAAEKKVKIIGDIPLYVALDSADAWAHQEQFQMGADHRPVDVAGTPPDAFSATGQRWGNPIYDWDYMKKDGFSWWISRIRRNLEFYDVIRIDHFNGLDSYYAIPFADETAENGKLRKGPGIALFQAIKKEMGDIRIIAEDLGNLTDSIRALLKASGFPGMKVLQFAFDGSESSEYLTHRHIQNCVVYTGTHDNMTTRGWIESINDHDRDFARRYINSIFTDYGQFTWDFIREAFRSPADLCIVPIQDFLVKGNEARLNNPGTLGENWQWRVTPNLLSQELCRAIHDMTKLYGRLPKEEPEKEPEEEAAQTD